MKNAENRKKEQVLIIGAEYGIPMMETYLERGAEVCAICHEPNISVEKLTYSFENLMLLYISRKLVAVTEILQYLAQTVRMPYCLDDFSTVIYLK